MRTLRAGGLLAVVTIAVAAAGGPARAQAPAEIHHIHGLAFDRRDPEILDVATHTGLVRLRAGATPEWTGDHRFDLMGFTAHPTTPDLVYASGHPDLPTYRKEKVGNLGLLASRDGGRTWTSVALRGQADFHALAWSPAGGGALWGWSVAGEPGLYRISTSTGAVARPAARGLADVYALAASPDAGGPLLAGTARGLVASRDGGVSFTPVGTIPPSVAVPALAYHPTDAALAYAYAHRQDLGLLQSRDGGVTWRPVGLFTGSDTPVVAIATGPGRHVAVATTAADVRRSRDGGRTWETVLARGRAAAR
ncbi:MAG: hypothetical protein HY614_02605 [Candidatus Rokubacteria bacterium]|nr:hypothetical protein [Candidatus Rokubacteria bacterium]